MNRWDARRQADRTADRRSRPRRSCASATPAGVNSRRRSCRRRYGSLSRARRSNRTAARCARPCDVDRLVDAPWVQSTDLEMVLMTCEQLDERGQLGARVLRDADWRERSALRQFDRSISAALGLLGLDPSSRSRMTVGRPEELDELSKLELTPDEQQVRTIRSLSSSINTSSTPLRISLLASRSRCIR